MCFGKMSPKGDIITEEQAFPDYNTAIKKDKEACIWDSSIF